MEGMMKVAIMTDIGKMDYVERPIPTPKDDEVLVKLEYVGICGSDMHYYESGAIGDFIVKPPFVLGHEPGGVVVEVGKNVHHLKVGDRVALEPGKTCGHCEYCREGKYNLCPRRRVLCHPRRWTACSRSMSRMRPACASRCPTMSPRWKAR